MSYALIMFGSRHRQTQVTDQGYAIYGVALKQLNQAISDPKCYTRDEVFLSIIIFALLEGQEPTGPNHFLNHIFALEKLLGMRDPNSNYGPKASELYKRARHMLIFSALRTRTPSLLATDEWKKAIRSLCSDD